LFPFDGGYERPMKAGLRLAVSDILIGNPSWRERAQQFRRKSAECHQLAENARYPETQRIYRSLAASYERLAAHADRNESPTSADVRRVRNRTND
jgi:hypothetical protein